MLLDYGHEQDTMTLYYDNINALSVSKNLVQQSRTKHIDIRHYFIQKLMDDREIELEYISTNKQLVDIFTKPLDATWFELLRSALKICLSP